VQRYVRKISGPLLDRIDLTVEVAAVPAADLHADGDGEPSAAVRGRVAAARKRQLERTGDPRVPNAALPARLARTHCRPDPEARRLLEQAVDRFGLTARGHQRVLRVARTIADLDGRSEVGVAHVAEALRYRRTGTAP